MGIYCISDVHGRKREFLELVERASIGATDEVYILGDIIDRGPESAEMLLWAVDEAPANFHFLLGNHESMLLDALLKQPEWIQISRSNPWNRNGGSATRRHLKKLTDSDWRRCVLRPWTSALPAHVFVNASGRDFLLVHAGVNPARMGELAPHRLYEESIDVGGGFGTQSKEDLVWIREEWYFDPVTAPCDVVHGHTEFTDGEIDKIIAAAPLLPFRGGRGRVCHYMGNRHNIDCGGAVGEAPYALGCLRLDDFEETYVMF